MGGVIVHIWRFAGKGSLSGSLAAALSSSGSAAIASSLNLIFSVMSFCHSLQFNISVWIMCRQPAAVRQLKSCIHQVLESTWANQDIACMTVQCPSVEPAKGHITSLTHLCCAIFCRLYSLDFAAASACSSGESCRSASSWGARAKRNLWTLLSEVPRSFWLFLLEVTALVGFAVALA